MPPLEHKKKQIETRKQIWILTYEHTSTTITPAMLQQHKIHPIECHTAAWRGSKHTLIHCERENRIGKAFVKSVTDKLSKNHSIVFEGPASGHSLLSDTHDDLTAHPGFVGIVELFKQRSADLHLWAGDGRTTHHDVMAMKKSVIHKKLKIDKKHAEGPEQKIADLTSEIENKVGKIAELSSQLDAKTQQTTDLTSELANRDQKIADLSSQLAAKEKRIAEMMTWQATQSNASKPNDSPTNPYIAQLQAELQQAQQERETERDRYNELCAKIIDTTTHAAYREFRNKMVAAKGGI
jgi:hypothetical protein